MNELLLIWLDTSFDEVTDNSWHTIKTQLRDVVGSIHIFTDTDRCIDFLTDVGDEIIFLIISGTYGQNIIPIVHEMSQLSSIYIFCGDKSRHEQWTKVKGVFTGTSLLGEALRQIVQDYIKIDEWSIISRLNLGFNYRLPIRLYFYDYFLHSSYDRSFRKMGFFIKNWNQYIGAYQSHLFIVDHYQGLLKSNFNLLITTKGGLMSFNNFLSTSKHRNVFLGSACHFLVKSNLLGILFVMSIDPSILFSCFTDVNDVNYDQDFKCEILFSVYSIIHIGQIKQINENTCVLQVDLTLTSDKKLQIGTFNEPVREETNKLCYNDIL